MAFLDQDRFHSTPKLPLYSFPTNRFCETPGLATPPVNTAGSIPFSWEEAPGKPRGKKPSKSKQNNLELPPRLLLSKEAYKSATNEFSPTTVLDGPYGLENRSLSLPRSSVIRKVKEKSLLFGSSRWRSLGKCKEISEGRFDFLLPLDRDDGGCDCHRDWSGGGEFPGDGGRKMKINWGVKGKGRIFDISRAKSDFWGRVYEGFKQVIVIPWKRRKQENLGRG